ncbi:MAG: TolC family protein [Bacteroidales bacterium]|nr:TolC family protein [Bacteroidales bacterium]
MKDKWILMLLALWPLAAGAQDTTLSLQECLDLSAQNDRTLRSAHWNVASARARQAEARWEYLPSIRVHAFGYRALHPMLEITLRDVLGNSDAAHVLREEITAAAYENGIKPYYQTFHHGYGTAATLLQPVYAGGRIRSGNHLADLGAEAAGVQDNLARKTVRDSVERKYWRIVALQEKRATLSDAVRLLDELGKDVESALQAGLATVPDRQKLMLKRSELLSGIFRLEGATSLLKMDLFDDIGYAYRYQDLPHIRLAGSLESFPPPEEVLADGTDPDGSDESRLLQMQVDAKRLERRLSVGELLPQVALGASYGYSALMAPKAGSANGVLFATVQVPITDLGKAAARSRRFHYEIRKAEDEQQRLQSKLQLRDRMRRLEVETTWKEMKVAEEAAAFAEESFERARIRFQAGMDTAATLLEARMNATAAQEALVNRRIAYCTAVNEFRSASR